MILLPWQLLYYSLDTLPNNDRYQLRRQYWKKTTRSPVLTLLVPLRTSTHLLGRQRPSALLRIMRQGLLQRSDAIPTSSPSLWLGNTYSSPTMPPISNSFPAIHDYHLLGCESCLRKWPVKEPSESGPEQKSLRHVCTRQLGDMQDPGVGANFRRSCGQCLFLHPGFLHHLFHLYHNHNPKP